MDLLRFTDKGIYCEQADVYIDPWQPVAKAIITHAHSDHARPGHQHYLCHPDTEPILRLRLGETLNISTLPYGKTTTINGVAFSLHPAGHLPGSAQVRVAYKGEVWVASGDYKVEDDGLSTPFEPVKCHTFITECTFGLPVYNWKPQAEIFEEINQWWASNQAAGKTTILCGYALGKAQRLLAHLNPDIGPIYTHGAVENVNEAFRNHGLALPDTIRVTQEIDKKQYRGAMVVATPSALGTPWERKFQPYSEGIASGWMGLRGARRRRSVDRGFVLSDHADWKGLNEAIKATGASRVIATHGYTNLFTRWLQEQGIEAITENTQFEGELSEINESGNQESGGET